MDEKSIRIPVSFDKDLIGKNSAYFSIYGEPFAKQRPRAARKGPFITIYTPKETKNYEKRVMIAYNRIYRGEQLDGALTVKIEGVFGVPKSASKKVQESMLKNEMPHIKKPDCDNMAKVCLDGLNGVAYPDDAIIDNLIVSKRYGEEPRVDIKIIQNKRL